MKIQDLIETEEVFSHESFSESVISWVKNLATDDVKYGFMTQYAFDLWFIIGDRKKIVVTFNYPGYSGNIKQPVASIYPYAATGQGSTIEFDTMNLMSPRRVAQEIIKCSLEWFK